MKTVRKPDADRTYQPRYAAIEITNRCNLRCLHCASDSGSARDNEMTTEEIIAVIDDLKRLGAEEITLMGGELFLHDEWDAMAAHVVENSMKLIVISNGLLMTKKKMRRLVDLDPYIIAISIDGATPETYRRIRGVDGFGKAMDALRALAGTGHPLVNAVTCFNRANFSEFDDFVSLFRGTPITWQVQLAGKGGSRFPDELFFTKDDYRAYVRKVLDLVSTADDPGVALMDDFGYFPLDPKFDSSAKWNACVCKWAGCQGGLLAIGIRSNGDVMPCLSLGAGFVVANLRDEPLESIWENDGYFDKFRNKVDYLTGACKACSAAEQCRGGCTDIALSATGGIGENPFCIRAMETEEILGVIASPPDIK